VRPTQWIITWLLYQIQGAEPVPFHLASGALDLANGLLLGVLAHRLLDSGDSPSQRRLIPAVAVSALFVFNWRHHEVVFWYSAINELLVALFKLSSLLLVLGAARATSVARAASRVAAALAAGALGLLSKESCIVLPAEVALVLAYDYLARCPRKWSIGLRALLVTSFVAVIAVWALRYVGTAQVSAPASVQRHGLTVLHASPSRYVLRLLMHLAGSFIGGAVIARSVPLMTTLLCLVLVLSVAAILRRRYLWLFALAWMCVALAPYVAAVGTNTPGQELSLAMLGPQADRALYYSGAGAALLLFASGKWLAYETRRLWRGTATRHVVQSVLGLGAVALVAINVNRMLDAEAEWDKAGEIATAILDQTQALVPEPPTDAVLCMHGLPDNFRGKYVFRQSISDALHLAYGRTDFTVRNHAPAWEEVSTCTHWLFYDGEPGLGSMRNALEPGTPHEAPRQNPLVTVSQSLRERVGVAVVKTGTWPVEDFGSMERGFLWLGSGGQKGVKVLLVSYSGPHDVALRCQLSPGPSREDLDRTVELTVWGDDGPLVQRRTFDEPTSISFEVHLRPGANAVQLAALEEATVAVLPNGDTRDLIVGLHEVVVAPSP
jgi:hypothetical protein